MTKIDIFSGFLGAGKTTLIKKLIEEQFQGQKLVLIENEFGEIGIDGGFLKEAGIEITEMNSGCICCSLVGDFSKALSEVLTRFSPDRIFIEPSGVGKLEDVQKAIRNVLNEHIVINSSTTVVDAVKCKMYMKNFGEFFNNQIENANAIVLSRTDVATPEQVADAVELLRAKNPTATIVTTPLAELSGADILSAIEHTEGLESLTADLYESEEICACCGKHHHEHHHDHHHEHGDDCTCGCHDHHHANEVFQSFGIETVRSYCKKEIETALADLTKQERYGSVLRAKGYVKGATDWIYFDYVPDEISVRSGAPAVTGRICVIGADLKKDALQKLFSKGE